MRSIEEQVILVTGSTDGIGKQTAIDLAQMGATVLLHGRSQERGEAVLQEIRKLTGNNKVKYYQADFSSLEEVRNLAKAIQCDYSHLDILINNAGIGTGDLYKTHRSLSHDGYELRFAVNYLAPFLLTRLLVPALNNSFSGQIVNVASVGQSPIDFHNVMLERNYSPFSTYKQSKLALVAFTFEFATRFKNITCNCLHPGTFLNTKMVRESDITPQGTVQSGSDAVIHLAILSNRDKITGKYYDQKREAKANKQVYDSL